MDDLDSIRDIFFEECKENLEILEDKLENFDSENYDEECISSIFRAVHSIKEYVDWCSISNCNFK